MNYTREQVELMDKSACQKALKKITQTYNLDKPIHEYMTTELWANLDPLIDTILYLEDRIAWIDQYGWASLPRGPRNKEE